MYNAFANIYDFVMRDTPYEAWIAYYEAVFGRFHKNPKLILDIGCGTGNITKRLAEKGYDMIGLDTSFGMLSKAREKDASSLYLHMDMTDFELYGTVDAMISALDCVNYVTEDVEKLFALVYNYLNPGGIFIFDINSPYKLREVLGNEPIVYDDDEMFYIWENELEEPFCHFYISFFIREQDGRYTRCDEMQTQRIYEVEELENAARKAGLVVHGVYDNLSFSPPKADSERLFFVIGKE